MEYFAPGSRMLGQLHCDINRRFRQKGEGGREEGPTFKHQLETSLTDVDAMNLSLRGKRRVHRAFN